jgi:glycosyltransferase involved in cell wall biosynthesis
LDKKLKILIISDSAALPGAQAEIIRNIFDVLLNQYPDLYEIHQIGLRHTYAVAIPRWIIQPTKTIQGCDSKLSLDPADYYGQLTFSEQISDLKPDIVFGFNHPSHLLYLCSHSLRRNYRLILCLCFDGVPCPPPADVGAMLNRADLLLTLTAYSQQLLRMLGPSMAPSKVQVAPIPADTSRFHRVSFEEKQALRRELLPKWMPPDAFIVGWIGRNLRRKQLWLAFKAVQYLRSGKYLLCRRCDRLSLIDWNPATQRYLDGTREVLESRPGYDYRICGHCGSAGVRRAEPLPDVYLWIHFLADGSQPAWAVRCLEYEFGLQPGRDVYYTEGMGLNSALSPDQMPLLYQIWDALLFLSGGGSFGLPAWEAMACALPVIYTNYSAHAEFLGAANAGLAVDGVLQPEENTCIKRMIADMPQAVAALRKLHADQALGRQLGANGRAYAQQRAPEIQAEKWHRLFQTVTGDAR